MLIESYDERRARSDHKRQTVLHFLREENWSNLPNLAAVTGLSEPAAYKSLCQMERDGWLLRHKVTELRMSLWGITPKGLLYSWGEEEQMHSLPHFEPSKLAVANIYHALDIQRARRLAEVAGWSHWIPGERLPKKLLKRPDATAASPAGNLIAIEIERTIKTLRRYEAIFAAYLQMIKRGEYSEVHYVCPDAGFAPRLRRMFALIQAVPVVGERVPITDKHRARFRVFALEAWPPNQGEMDLIHG